TEGRDQDEHRRDTGPGAEPCLELDARFGKYFAEEREVHVGPSGWNLPRDGERVTGGPDFSSRSPTPVHPSTVGYQTTASAFEYGYRKTVLYARGDGATQNELDYLYEGRRPTVPPTFAVEHAYAVGFEVFERTGCELSLVLHSGHNVRLTQLIP